MTIRLFSFLIKRVENRNQRILNRFSSESSWEERYKIIISMGKALPPFAEKDRLPERLIKGCQSRLWLKAEISGKGEVVFTGDSEGLITKGILALMIDFYSLRSPEEILRSKALFLEQLELAQYLSSRRTNGLQSLLDQIKNYAKAFFILSKGGAQNSENP